MDPVTHMLTGACFGRAGLNRSTALATATLVVAAEIPDIDVLYELGGSLMGAQHHRGWTHSFAGVPVMVGLALGLVWAWSRIFPAWTPWGHAERPRLPVRWRILAGFALLGVLSHLLLDYTTSYGIRLLAPFSYRWFRWDIVYIVEPLLTLALAIGLGLPALVAFRHRANPSPLAARAVRVGAVLALVCMLLMWGVRAFEHGRALAQLRAARYHDAEPIRVSAYPYPWDPFRWHGVVETAGFFETVPIDARRRAAAITTRTFYKHPDSDVILAAKRSPLGKVYLSWAVYPVVEEEPRPGGSYWVRFFDLRYTYPESSFLTGYVELDRDLRVVAEGFERRSQRKSP